MGSWPDRYRKLVADLPRLAASARTTACLTSTCVDARVLLADAPAGPTGDAQADDLLSILRGRAAAGIGGEIICDWPGGPQWLENTLPVRRAWGGTGPHAAMALTAIGAPAICALDDRSARMLSVIPEAVPLAHDGKAVPAGRIAPAGQPRPEVFIIEYTAGQPAAGVVPPRSSRIILRFGDLGIERDADFDRITTDGSLDVGAALIAGFQCVPPPDLAGEYARISDQIRRWRAAGTGVVHLELAGFTSAPACHAALREMAGKITSLGMSESEFRQFFGPGDPTEQMIRAAEDLGLARLCVHADHWAATVTRDDPDRELMAIMTGSLLAATRAHLGQAARPAALPEGAEILNPRFGPPGGGIEDRGGWSLVSCPTLYLPAPATTLGMGDTFTGGCLMILGLPARPDRRL